MFMILQKSDGWLRVMQGDELSRGTVLERMYWAWQPRDLRQQSFPVLSEAHVVKH